jgi:O-antigen/teichoic acid export membrane protein
MSAPVIEVDRRGFRARGTGFMVAGSLIGAVGAYLFQVYGGRALGADAFAPIGVLWTTFFILATVLLIPVEQYVTREVASGRKALPRDLVPAGVMVAIGALLGAVYVFLTLDSTFDGDPQYILQIILIMVGYGLLMVAKGILAGSRRFADVGWVLIVESVARLAAGVAAVLLFANATSMGWAMVIGPFAVLALGWWRRDDGDSRSRHDPASGFLAGYAGGTAASQILLASAPIAVAAFGGSRALISVVFVTFTLYRAPLTLIFSLQGRILPYMVGLARDREYERLTRIARSVVGYGALLAVLGGAVGWLIGPEVVTLLYTSEFTPSAVVAGLAAAGVMAAAAAQVASQVLVAEGRTARLSIAWLGGLAAAVVVLLVTAAEPDVRVATAFAVGEFSALGLMAILATKR